MREKLRRHHTSTVILRGLTELITSDFHSLKISSRVSQVSKRSSHHQWMVLTTTTSMARYDSRSLVNSWPDRVFILILGFIVDFLHLLVGIALVSQVLVLQLQISQPLLQLCHILLVVQLLKLYFLLIPGM